MVIEECFICEPDDLSLQSERPRQWRQLRVACQEHAGQAVFENGMPVRVHFLAISPVEGSGLNKILNPVFIAGKRCWADYVAGSFLILEEFLESNNYFEFFTQHVPDYVDMIYSFSTLEHELTFENKRKAMLGWIVKNGNTRTTYDTYNELFDRLFRFWQEQEYINQKTYPSERFALRTIDEFNNFVPQEIYHNLMEDDQMEYRFYQEIFRIARQRFHHFTLSP